MVTVAKPVVEYPLGKVALVAVAYSQPEVLAAKLRSLTPGMVDVLVVDNTLDARYRSMQTAESYPVLRNRNVDGLAGAYNCAIAEIATWAVLPEYVLYFDEDSDVSAIEPFLLSRKRRTTTADLSVAAVAPSYVDPETNIAGAPVQLARWRWRILSRNLSDEVEVSFLINSMSLWRWSVLQKIGQYRTDLGVDHIDSDYCLRAQALGFRLVLDPSVRFAHSIGKRYAYRFLWFTFQAGGHSAERRYSIARTTLILMRLHGRRWPALLGLCLARLAYEAIGIVAVEDDKVAKLGALLRGGAAGIRAHLNA